MDEPTETLDSSTEETETTDSSNGTEESTEQQSTEYTEREKQYYERIKALERKLKEKEDVKTEPSQSTGLSPKDFLALKDANISADDFDEVQEFAAFRKVSIAEALRTSTLKTILAEKSEERRTAQATLTRSPRGTSKATGEDVLRKAEKTGEVPDDDAALRELAAARLARRKK